MYHIANTTADVAVVTDGWDAGSVVRLKWKNDGVMDGMSDEDEDDELTYATWGESEKSDYDEAVKWSWKFIPETRWWV